MIPGKFLWKPMFQKMVTGRWRRFNLTPVSPAYPADLKRAGLYLHVPFCKNLCPFCPYNRVEYEDGLFAAYEQAVKQEIDLYAPSLEGVEFISLYIGGGTPTVNFDGLLRIVDHLKFRLAVDCDICIELHPANMEPDCLSGLKQAGVTMLSVGIESTSDEILKRIGRNHDGRTAVESLERAVSAGFDAVNIDLMFALPGQTLEDWALDLRRVIAAGTDQISTYPLFSFPYSDLGQSARIRGVKRPRSGLIRAMLDLTQEISREEGYERCAVWSWLRSSKKKFSSITRHHYIGFGPSAASMTGTDFYVNTFDVQAYSRALPEKRPVALSMPVDRRLEMAYWLYWRVYDLKIGHRDFQDLFGSEDNLDDVFAKVIKPFQRIGMMERKNGEYRVTESGAYYIHRLQNEYSLNYINRLWGSCRHEPWPRRVSL